MGVPIEVFIPKDEAQEKQKQRRMFYPAKVSPGHNHLLAKKLDMNE